MNEKKKKNKIYSFIVLLISAPSLNIHIIQQIINDGWKVGDSIYKRI